MRFFILCFLFVLTGNNVRSQSYFTIEQGLSDNTVSTVFKDGNGFLWVGTLNGLNRFDGYRFLSFFNVPGDSTSLSDNAIRDIIEDLKGNIWVATDNGLNKYNPRTEVFTRIGHNSSQTSNLSNQFIFYLKIVNDNLIVGHWTGASIINLNTLEIKNYTLNENEEWAMGAKCMFADDSVIWIGTNYKGLYKLQYQKHKKNIDGDFEHVEVTDERISSITGYKNSVILGNAIGELYFLDKKTNDIKKLVYPDNRWIQDMLVHDSTLYYASWFNVFSLPLSEQQRAEKNIKKFGAGFPGYIRRLNLNNNIIWCGIDENGLTFINTNFTDLNSISLNELGIPNGEIIGLFEDRLKNLWVFSNNKAGIIQNRKLNDRIKISNNIYIELPQKETYLDFTRLYQSKNLDYWLVYQDKIERINYATGEITAHRIEKYSGEQKRILKTSYIIEDNNELYVKADKLYKFDFVLQSFVETNEFSNPLFYNLDSIKFLNKYFDQKHQTLWHNSYGTKLYKENFSNDEHFMYPVDLISGLHVSEQIVQMVTDTNQVLWIASNQGVHSLNIQDTSSTFLRKMDGLTHHSMSGINVDGKNRIWISSHNGINILDQEDGSIYQLYKGNGLGTNLFKSRLFLKKYDGRFVLGGQDRIIIFDPDNITFKNEFDLPLVFTKMKTGKGEGKLLKYAHKTENITLAYKDNSLMLEFSLLSLLDAEKCKYQYKFDDDEWVSLGNSRTLNLSNLQPGKHTIKVVAFTPSGLKTDIPLNLTVTIKAPWYKTILFKFFILVFVLAVIIIIYRIRIRRINQFNKRLKAEVKERTRQIESQKEELRQQAENMKEINVLLSEQSEELKATTEELSISNKTKDKFFSIIAHDLKNPFMGIMSFSKLLHSRFYELNDDKKLEFISHVKDSSEMAYQLLENLLQWSMNQTKKMKYDPESFNVNEVVSTCVDLLILNAENKKIQLHNNTEKGHAVFADKNMITTVIRNIISNAIKFTPENGTVKIFATKKEDYIEVHVKDTGHGIHPDDIPALFAIEKVRSTDGTSGEKGTGLGLSLCKDFVEMNKGSIHVESEPSKGSDFIISIPESQSTGISEDIESFKASPVEDSEILNPDNIITDAIDEKQFTDYTILIVEDNDEIRKGIRSYLENNFKILEAKNGKEGVNLAKKEIPNFIVSDIMMPELDGFELASTLKKDEHTSHIPLILLTARNSNESQIKGLESGVDDYLTKPIDPRILHTRIKNILHNRKQLQLRMAKDIVIKPEEVTTNITDEQFLKRAIQIIEENIDNPEFSVEIFSQQIGMGRTMLYKKMNQLTGEPINEFIRKLRFKKAALLLINSDLTISEIAYKVGFNNIYSFSRAFSKEFGMSPSEWKNKDRKNLM